MTAWLEGKADGSMVLYRPGIQPLVLEWPVNLDTVLRHATKGKVTAQQRIARALDVGQRWAATLEANAANASSIEVQRRCQARAMDIRDLLEILDGTEDDYIAHLNEREG